MATNQKAINVSAGNASATTVTKITDTMPGVPCPDPAGYKYVGARYVPLFANPIQWDETKQTTYEPLTIVLYQGNSYTSKQYVPVGVDITNEDFWANTGNYNAQVEQYRQEVLSYAQRVDAIELELDAIELEYCKCYGTVAEMKADTALQAGMTVHTNGFNVADDGGAAYYTVSATGTANEMDVIALENGLNATLLPESTLYIEQLGISTQKNADNNTAALTRAFTFISDKGIEILSSRKQENVYGFNTGSTPINIASPVRIEKISFELNDSMIFLTVNSDDVTIKDCYFHNGSQNIMLNNCNRIRIEDCEFDYTGYDIIQNMNTHSNDVIVSGCTIKDSLLDFVEINSADKSGTCTGWKILNNNYLGAYNYSSTENTTENRFIGITSGDGILIQGNYAVNVPGDAIVHIENTTKSVKICNNYFGNCRSKFGVIVLYEPTVDVEICGNTFVTNNVVVYQYVSGSKSVKILFENNNVNTTSYVFSLDQDSPSGDNNFVSIIGNIISANFLAKALKAAKVKYLIANNTVTGQLINAEGLVNPFLTNATIIGNTVFSGDELAIACADTTNGSQSTNCYIANNVLENGISLYYPDKSVISNNELKNGTIVAHTGLNHNKVYVSGNTLNGVPIDV